MNQGCAFIPLRRETPLSYVDKEGESLVESHGQVHLPLVSNIVHYIAPAQATSNMHTLGELIDQKVMSTECWFCSHVCSPPFMALVFPPCECGTSKRGA